MMMEPNQIQNPAPYDGKQPPAFGPRVREPQETLQIRPRAAASSNLPPLKLTIKQGTAANKFQIVPGTVNYVMPTLATIALDAATPPEITVTADTWVWVKVVGDFDEFGEDTYTVTIVTSSTSSMPSGTEITETGFTSYRLIGYVDFTAGSPDTFSINNIFSGGDLGVESFGNVNHWWKQ